MVKLLTEAGASSIQETKHDKKVPIQFAAASRHTVRFEKFKHLSLTWKLGKYAILLW